MKKRRVLIVFYSLQGMTALAAEEIRRGASQVRGTEAIVKMVPELLPDSFFEKNPLFQKERQRLKKKYEQASVHDLIEADGIAFGTPVHFGSFASQMKHFLDGLSSVWMQRNLVNKPASVFTVGGSLHGGEELTLMSLMIPLLNLGMIPVGIPYPIQGEGPEFDAGSPYGAIVVHHSKKEKRLTIHEKKICRILGQRLASMTHLMTCACQRCGNCHASLK